MSLSFLWAQLTEKTKYCGQLLVIWQIFLLKGIPIIWLEMAGVVLVETLEAHILRYLKRCSERG